MSLPPIPDQFTTKIYKITIWLSLIGIIGSLFVQARGLTNREALTFFVSLFILSATLWQQEIKGTTVVRIAGVPHSVSGTFVQWRLWGKLVAIGTIVLICIVILDMIWPSALPGSLHAFFEGT